MTSVTVNTYTHSVTYVSDNMLKSLKEIIRLSGLDPAALVDSWETYSRGLRTWLGSQHLECVVLEVFHPETNALLVRWDLNIEYGWSAADGHVWMDTDQLRYHIQKAGVAPAQAKYRLIVKNKEGRPEVEGWSSCEFRPTTGMVRQSLGSTIEHSGLGASAAYWRKS
jgi:hypothetical protein